MSTIFFPIKLSVHIVLALLALLVFGLQFVRLRKPKYLILAVILPISMIPYLSDSRMLFNAVGIVEGIGLLITLVLHIVDSRKEAAKLAAEEQAVASSEGTEA